ncbi:MAG: hypothetical protein LC777_13215 [Actinobacteria bacterium]|nr:hypothetical protein [Actinomycetota bacterium]
MALLKNTASRAKALDFSTLLTTGTLAGLAAGFPFILANMIYATSQSALPVPNAPKLPAIAPFFDIGTIFYFDDMPQMTNPSYPLAGLITHFSLSIVFGLIFALAVVPLLTNARLLLIGSVVFGGLLYIVNYQILGRMVFEWFDPSSPLGPDPWFGLITHLGFGLLLAPFFLTTVSRSPR